MDFQFIFETAKWKIYRNCISWHGDYSDESRIFDSKQSEGRGKKEKKKKTARLIYITIFFFFFCPPCAKNFFCSFQVRITHSISCSYPHFSSRHFLVPFPVQFMSMETKGLELFESILRQVASELPDLQKRSFWVAALFIFVRISIFFRTNCFSKKITE